MSSCIFVNKKPSLFKRVAYCGGPDGTRTRNTNFVGKYFAI